MSLQNSDYHNQVTLTKTKSSWLIPQELFSEVEKPLTTQFYMFFKFKAKSQIKHQEYDVNIRNKYMGN